MSTTLTGQQILDLPMGDNTADARTVRDYLIKLLRELWRDSGSFTGKYAFGSSDWQYNLYQALADAGLITAKFDENGYFEECDTESGGRLIASAIDALGRWTPMAGETLPGLHDMLASLPKERIPFEQATEATYGRLYDAKEKFQALHAEAEAEVERLRKEAADLRTTLILVGGGLKFVREHTETAKDERDRLKVAVQALAKHCQQAAIEARQHNDRTRPMDWEFVHQELAKLVPLADDFPADPVVVSRADLRRYFDSENDDLSASVDGLRRLWTAAGIETP